MKRSAQAWRGTSFSSAPVVLTLLALASMALTGAATPNPIETRLVAAAPLVRIGDPGIDESSGLATDPTGTLLYTIQDAGKPAEVYGLSAATGERLLTVRLRGVKNLDWEDIARGTDEAGQPSLFVADAGDAEILRAKGAPARSEFALYRFREPALPTGGPKIVDAASLVRWPIKYEDGQPRNSESLAVQPGTNRIFVVNKNTPPVQAGKPPAQQAEVWIAPGKMSNMSMNVLRRVSSVPFPEATGATFSPSGDLFVVRDYDSAYLWQVQNGDMGAALRAKPVVLPLPTQRQGESIAFTPDGSRLLIGSEGPNSTIWQVPLPTAVAPTTAQTNLPVPAPDSGGLPWKYIVFVGVCVVGLGALAAGAVVPRLRRRREDVRVERKLGGRRRAR